METSGPATQVMQSLLPLLQIVVALWAAEAILTMLLKEHRKSKKKKEREKRRLEYQDRRMANDEEHAKVTRAMRYDVLRRDGFKCVKCGRGREDGVKLHVDHIKPVSRGGKSVDEQPADSLRGLQLREGKQVRGVTVLRRQSHRQAGDDTMQEAKGAGHHTVPRPLCLYPERFHTFRFSKRPE